MNTTEQIDIRKSLKKPYWATDVDLPSHDFCRELITPGKNKNFPEGAIGLRVDDDFWAVAALPNKYLNWSLEDIVKNLWPHAWKATFHPDSGTLAQKVEYLEAKVYHLGVENRGLYSKIRRFEQQARHWELPARREDLPPEGQDA